MADPSIVPTYLLSEVTRRHVTVALGGDGDELFGGYELFPAFLLAEQYVKIPLGGFREACLEPLSRFLPISSGYVSPRHVVASSSPESRRPHGCGPKSGLARLLRSFKRPCGRRHYMTP